MLLIKKKKKRSDFFLATELTKKKERKRLSLHDHKTDYNYTIMKKRTTLLILLRERVSVLLLECVCSQSPRKTHLGLKLRYLLSR